MDNNFFDLTNPQQEIWNVEQYYKNTNINNVCGIYKSSVPLNFKFFLKAIQIFVKVNDSFRLRLTLKDGNIKQYLTPYSPFNVDFVDIKNNSDLKKIAQKECSRVFTLFDSTLFNFIVFRYPNNYGGFIINSHHIISDAWTSGILANEISQIYLDLINNSFTEIKHFSYIDYIKSENDYLNSSKFQKDKEYWDTVFETIPEVATLPYINDSPKTSSILANRLTKNLDKRIMLKLKSYCNRNKISLYNLFSGVYSFYLGRVSNLDSFTIGTPILNRSTVKEKHTAGMFINVLPLKIELNHDEKFTSFLSQIAIKSIGLLRHQKYSYNNIIKDLRKKDHSVSNLYNVILSYQITKMNENNAEFPHKTEWIFNGSTLNDLDIHIYEWNESDKLQIAYDYNVEKYTETEIANVHNRILHVLEQIINNENILLREIELVTINEKKLLLQDFNNTQKKYPNNKTVIELFEEQVRKTPNKVAVVFENQQLTFSELNEKANCLANYLIENGATSGDVIGIFLDKSLEIISSMLGILKANCTFLPLDISYPQERIQYIINDSKVKFLLSSTNFESFLQFSKCFVNVSLSNQEIYNSQFNLPVENIKRSPESIMYIIYTSGSTGKPKGVLVKNQNITRLIFNQNFINFSKIENMVQTGTIAFDACIFEIFTPLTHGFTLHILPKSILLDVKAFQKFIIEKQITILFLTTGIFNEFGNIAPEMFKNLKYLLTGGDVISFSATHNIQKSCPNIKIINCYGPTENGSYSTTFTLSKKWHENYIPIGKPIANSSAYIVSRTGNLQPIGATGELWVGGDGIAQGYVNRTDLTELKFINSPFGEGKVYKTGDLVRYDKYNNICFVGRIDNQIKLRGFRIELSEIDKIILNDEKIKNSISIINKNHTAIYTYIISDETVDITELKKNISQYLPHYMIPSSIIQLKTFPISVNGKIDRKKLPIPKKKSGNQIANARNTTDQKIVSLLKNILNVSEISIENSFIEIGGDSLSAINFSLMLSDIFKIDISAKDILEHPIISDLSDLVEKKSNVPDEFALSKVGEATSYKLSAVQNNIYIASKISGESSLLYNIAGAIIFGQKPNFSKLDKCINKLVKRHESFRTYFEIENEEVVQKILPNAKLEIETVNEISIDSALQNFIRPFDLSTAPLIRAEFVILEKNRFALLIDMHHLVSDGTSMQIFIDELSKLYNEQELHSIQYTYKDFSYFENQKILNGEFNEAKNYWKNQFSDEIPILNLPTVYNRPAVKSYEGSKVYSQLDSSITEKINNICKKYSVTPYMFLLTAYYILLSKYSGQEDIIIGSPFVGRNSKEFSNIIGMFVNTLPIRISHENNISFKKLLNNVKAKCLENYKYQDYPLNEIINDLNIKRDTSHAPLFDTLFIYQNSKIKNASFGNIASELHVPDLGISKFDLSLEVTPVEKSLNLTFEYSSKLFNKQFIENLANHYINIVFSVLNNLNVNISEINMLSEVEKNKILYSMNSTVFEYEVDKNIVQIFEKQAQKSAQNIAIKFEEKSLTYAEVNEKANCLANYLVKNNISSGDIVGIMVNRSLEMIIAILAVLKSGAAYIPIDPEYPEDRISYMLENSKAKTLLTLKSVKNNKKFSNKIFIDLSNSEIYSLNIENLGISTKPLDPCYIIYTSGSTGKPKGVVLNHKAVSNLCSYLSKNFEFFSNKSIQKNIVSVTTMSFDIFLFETIFALANGLKLVICTEEEQHLPDLLEKKLLENKINIMQMTPSRMETFLNNISSTNCLKNLEYVVLAGEVLPYSLVKRLKELGINNIYNGYGPSETTVFSSFTDVTEQTAITIGKPLANTEFYILDKNQNPCPLNVPGELYIAGDGLANEYINNTELTQKSFIDNPFVNETKMYKTGDLCKALPSGEYVCLGRIDNQMKIRGLRVELGEIENKINEFPYVKKSCVVKQVLNNREFISAYLTITRKINTSELRNYVASYLPKYMVPSYFVILDDFPYTPNGKIDKKKLTLPKEIYNSENSNYVKPQNKLEKDLVKIFENVLNISPIGIEDNFFELGGDSILAMNLNIELKKISNKISYADIFNYQTISNLEKKIVSDSLEFDEEFNKQNYEKYNSILEKNKIVPKWYELRYQKPGNILLTGATGFLGSHVLDSFLKNEKGNVYCLVRNENGLTSNLKLCQKLNYYFGDKYTKLIGKRIFTVSGDITSPHFGLNSEELLDLANNVDVVINCAANVSHYGKYQDFYKTNTQSVKYMLEFCKNFNKRFYQVSTISISGNTSESNSLEQRIGKKTIFDETSLYIEQSLENVYIKSKFEAECLVLDAILDGVNAHILRVGNLMPRYSDGTFQENVSSNAYINRILAFANLGCMPDYLNKAYLELTPIDYTAKSIIKIVEHPNDNFRIFHLYNNNNVYLPQFEPFMLELNPNFSVVNEHDFIVNLKEALNDKKQENKINELTNDLNKDLHFIYFTDIIIKSDNTLKYLGKIGFRWPKIGKKYLDNFINLLRRKL